MANLLVIVSYKVFPAQMGGQKGIVLFYEYLKKHHGIWMAVSQDNEVDDKPYGVDKILYANRQIGRNFFKIPLLYKIIKKKKIECVIAEHSYTAWIGLVLRRLAGTPFIIHSHNIEASRFRQMNKRGWKVYHQYEKWIHRKADFNFFKTEEEYLSAIQYYSLNPAKCAVIPYGIEGYKKIDRAKERFREVYGINSTYLFYFNGTLDYKPNEKAVECLIDFINPLLLTAGIDFTIFISGKRLSPQLKEKIRSAKTICYLDFVQDVSLLYQASTLFLNPVVNDSGVKTKVVEALANQCTVVSTASGAAGIPKSCTGEKLVTVKDGDWQGFTDQILTCLKRPSTETPRVFYNYFSWKNVAKKASTHIEDLLKYA